MEIRASDPVIDHPAIRRLQLRSSRLVTTIFAGEYRSAFRGRGIEFNDVREYQPGDDIRAIDWNVTARQGRPFIKQFLEEREQTLVMVLDRSLSMNFGTVRATKLQVATEACALLAFAALRSHDRLALITFGDGELRMLPPGKGKRHTLRLIRDAMATGDSPNKDIGLSAALDYLTHVVHGRVLVCIVSDFHDPIPVRSLSAVAARHDAIAISVSDPLEHEIPAAGLLTLTDPETGSFRRIDTNSQAVRREYKLRQLQNHTRRKDEIAGAGADLLELSTRLPPLYPLMQFFRNRKRVRSA
jgi:uncharacterized protein (DUF58 family)